MKKSLLKIKFTVIFILLISISSQLSGYYWPERYAFLAVSEKNFDNNKSSKFTWMEPADNHFIEPLKPYLKFIPKPYHSDTFSCKECGGLAFCLTASCNYPSDANLLYEIHDSHIYVKNNDLFSCKKGDNYEKNILCWDGGYFRKWNQKYGHFFKHYLHYCSENSSCKCYWPEKSLNAVQINDKVYYFIKSLCEDSLIDSSFSPYWSAKFTQYTDYRIGFLWPGSYTEKIFGENYYPKEHGMASSLTTYTFFYSQYHKLLLSIASHIDSNSSIYDSCETIDSIYEMLESVRDDYLPLYDFCLKKHPHPKIFYERGMLKMHSGDVEDALHDIIQMMELAQNDNSGIELTSEMYSQEGQAYCELGLYDKAVSSLTEAIKRDPNNKEAYFHRAAAYFETGNFDQALKDYLISKEGGKISKSYIETSTDFSVALLKSAGHGAGEAIVDFVPSLCHSAYGLSTILWTTAKHPIETTKNFAGACYEMGECLSDYCSTVDWDTLDEYSQEIKTLSENFYSLSETEKGELIGYAIGKYGVEIFAGGAIIKGVKTYRNLVSANRICTLEAMALSAADKKAIAEAALKHAAARQAYIKNVKYNYDAHNKHVCGHNDFLQTRSVWEHKDPEGLLRKYSGTGHSERGVLGTPGYKETVDFKEHIGIWKKDNIALPTTRGTIHYGEKGAHIVPSNPNPIYRGKE